MSHDIRISSTRLVKEQAAALDGDHAEKQRRTKAGRSHQYIYSSYDPMVTKWYAEAFPFIADKMTVVISTRKTAMTKELKTLAQRLGASGVMPDAGWGWEPQGGPEVRWQGDRGGRAYLA